ncbi:hypothetical protein CSW37_10920 [Thermus scotoductus]|jgi:hypothetical protein|uniref:Uncharacterized protein n=3 Tax=Thermus TaxID=270 RepID=A0A0N0IQU5_THESC|nr:MULTISPECIES: hypothetical protein [Thermus]ADW22570.1 conserved hypothetical protein [Thermus scotoductus SA-01]ETN89575.1 hypothetical protein TNMX_00980 [Thermus sp. NMX2.A1]KPD32086.1 hypothetical protein AN926_05740 [Thermus scotoductus]MBW6394289.1 hypothetical protein [Thermus brevis]RTG92120.1 hypothetical protein CSW51_11610 [Thermus scotoductus]
MNPNRLSQSLALLGVAAYAYFLFLRPNQEGMALAVGLFVGTMGVAYGEKPFLVPFFVGLFALLFLLQLLFGHPIPFLTGGALGVGLPYLVYRLRKPAR